MDLKFLWHSVNSVAYLINRLLTSVLNFKSPFEALYHTPLVYQFLKTFGCACYPYLHPYNKHKLHYLTSLYIFLGYSSTQKRHKCLHSSRQGYIAHMVTFDESMIPYLQLFPYSPTFSSPTYSSLHPFPNDVLPHSSSIPILSPTLPPTSPPILSSTPSPSSNASGNPSFLPFHLITLLLPYLLL